jgi:hypothetical protein
LIDRSIEKRAAIVALAAMLLSACSSPERNATPPAATPTPASSPTVADVPTKGSALVATYTPAATDLPVATDQPAPAGDQATGKAYVSSLSLTVMESFPVQVQAHISGDLSDGCTSLAGVDVQRDGQTFLIQVTTTRPAEAVCIQVLAPFETTVDLDTVGLAAGTYTVTAGDVSDSFSLAADNSAQAAPESGVNEPVDGLVSRTYIYLIAIGDDGQSGPLVGCQDSAVPVVVEIEPTAAPMTAAIQRLLADKRQYYGQSGLYNVFYQSGLQLEGVKVVSGQATINLSGSLTLGGVCDDPRVMAQLQQTALQYSTVTSAVIYLNGQPLESILSGR